MTQKYVVEALLREPAELYSAVMMSIGCALTLFSPALFMLPRSVSYSVALCLAFLAIWRFRQGLYVIRYQRGLVRSPKFVMRESKLPVKQEMLYLGDGFEWTGKHTQRIHDARDEKAEKYVQQRPFIRRLRLMEVEWGGRPLLGFIPKVTSWDSILNPLRPLPNNGGEPMLHGVGREHEHRCYMSLQERSGHVVVKGSTGVGKTVAARMYITQDIRRKNNCVVVIDPKGDPDLLLTTYTEAVEAGRKIYVLHLGFPELSARYNAIGSFSRITEIPTRIASPLPGEGDAAAFKDFVWLFVNVISVAVVNLGEVVTYEVVQRYMRQIDPLLLKYGKHWLSTRHEDWEETFKTFRQSTTTKSINGTNFKGRDIEAVAMHRTLEQYKAEDSIIAGLLHAFQYEKTYFDKITNAVGPFLEKLTSGRISEILSPNLADMEDSRPVIDWEQVLRQEAVVYVGLDALTDPEVAAAVGSGMFSDLTSLAGRKTKHGPIPGLPDIGISRYPSIIIHGDEFSDLIGPNMVTLLNKSRSAGFSLNLYTQTWSDVEAKLGNAAKAGQIAGNLNTTIMMRVKELATAEMLTNQLPEINVSTVMEVSGVNDGDPSQDGVISFSSRNEDRISKVPEPMLKPVDIVGLPMGEAYALLSGSHLHKIRIPFIKKDFDERKLPHYIKGMVADMRDHYHSTDGWFQYTDSIDLHGLSE